MSFLKPIRIFACDSQSKLDILSVFTNSSKGKLYYPEYIDHYSNCVGLQAPSCILKCEIVHKFTLSFRTIANLLLDSDVYNLVYYVSPPCNHKHANVRVNNNVLTLESLGHVNVQFNVFTCILNFMCYDLLIKCAPISNLLLDSNVYNLVSKDQVLLKSCRLIAFKIPSLLMHM